MKPVIVSSCLAGHFCRYDGGSKPHPVIVALCRKGLAIPVCPESLSGLPVPRPACEQVNNRAILRDGSDVTEELLKGAHLALQKARQSGADIAILKSKSPSCGIGEIYDGTFSGRLAPGMGFFASLLAQAGLELYSENNFPTHLSRMAARDEPEK